MKILKATELLKEIKGIMEHDKINCIDALLFYSEKHNIEMETLARVIKSSKTFKAIVKKDAESCNMLKK